METVRTKRKKAGRPVKAVKKEVRACVRFTKTEYFIVREKASKAGLKASEYIRQITINGQVKNRLAEEERQFARQLIGMANNLNQLAKACHQEGLLQAMVYFETYRNHFDEILGKLKS
jgi:hypothetical protein